MPSEHIHIDHFFRGKEEELSTDNTGMSANWKAMQMMMPTLSAPLPRKIRSIQPFKKYLAYAAGVILILTVTIVATISPKRTATSLTLRSGKDKITPLLFRKGIHNNTDQTVTTVLVEKRKPLTVKPSTQPAPENGANHEDIPSIIIHDVSKSLTTEIDPVDNTNKPDAATLFNTFYKELRKPAQEFVINTKKDTLIVCKEGTKIHIPAGCFQTLTGMAITGIITIHVQEFYDFADIITNKLTTESNGEALESGGMLNIKVTDDVQQELSIRPGASLDLTMPTYNFDPEMQLFTGAVKTSGTKSDGFDPSTFTGGINWVQAGQSQYFFDNNKKYITILDLRNEPIREHYNGNKRIAVFKVDHETVKTNDEIRLELEKKYGKYYDVIKVKRAWKALWKKNRVLTKNDWYDSYQITGDSIFIPLHIASRLKLITKEDSIHFEEVFSQMLEKAKMQRQTTAYYLKKQDGYIFQIKTLGWINCDRFLKYPGSRLTNFEVDAGIDFERGFFQAMIVFKKERTAMSGYLDNGKIIFGKIPVGHEITLVCTGIKNGKMMCVVKDLKVERKTKTTLQFEETSPTLFREKMRRFGNVQYASN